MTMPVSTLHTPLVRVCQGQVTLAGRRVLRDLSLCIRQGEHLTVQGANGAGKSTLLRLLRGEQWLDQKNGGTIHWFTTENAAENGFETTSEPQGESSPLCGRSLGALVCAAEQERVLDQGWPVSAADYILAGFTDSIFVRPHSATPEEKTRICQAAQRVRAEALLDRLLPTLSQGELRLVLMARALVRDPALLFLDEVTDGLDALARQNVLEILQNLAEHCTLVVSSHRPETLPDWIARRVVLHEGQVVFDGPTRMAPVTATSPSPVLGGTPPEQEATLPSRLLPGVDVRLVNASVYLDGTPILHNINWHIQPGQNWLVRGPNGAGKSTLLRLLAGEVFPACGGSITRFLPRQGGQVHCLADIKRGVRLISDIWQATYAYNLCGEELVASGLDNSVGLYRAITPDEQCHVHRALDLLHVRHLAQRPFRACSTGESRRLLLARAIVGNPDLLLLDEPCSGLDSAGRNDFLRLLEHLIKEGVQIVLVTHHEDDLIAGLTDRLHIAEGRLF